MAPVLDGGVAHPAFQGCPFSSQPDVWPPATAQSFSEFHEKSLIWRCRRQSFPGRIVNGNGGAHGIPRQM